MKDFDEIKAEQLNPNEVSETDLPYCEEEDTAERSGSFAFGFAPIAAAVVVFAVLILLAVGLRYDDKVLTERLERLEGEVSYLHEEYEKLASRKESTSTVIAKLYDGTGKKPIDEDSVYYGVTWRDLWDDSCYDDEVLALLAGQLKIEVGTAGVSYQFMRRGSDFVSIAVKGEEAWQGIPAFLDTLSPAALDYLSYRMFDAYQYALDIIHGGRTLEEFLNIGYSSTLYEGCSEVELARFFCYMLGLLEEKGVTFEWQTYDIMSIF